MTNYVRVISSNRPEKLEITGTSVFIASNIEEYEEEIEDVVIHGYEYDYIAYEKDEYLTTVAIQNMHAITELQDELEATKILLGVD